MITKVQETGPPFSLCISLARFISEKAFLYLAFTHKSAT